MLKAGVPETHFPEISDIISILLAFDAIELAQPKK
jgi:hypothetical protein